MSDCQGVLVYWILPRLNKEYLNPPYGRLFRDSLDCVYLEVSEIHKAEIEKWLIRHVATYMLMPF